jgi:hypothetical protein
MDLTFAEAMQKIADFHPNWELAVFDGPALRGVMQVSAPDVCIHGDQFETAEPIVRVFDGGRAVATYECGCVYLGSFRRSRRR